MLNKRQKAFRSHMKQIERNMRVNNIKDPPSYINKPKRTVRFKKSSFFTVSSLIGVVFIALNVHSITSWLNTSNLKLSVPTINLNSSQEKVHLYVSKSSQVEQDLGLIVSACFGENLDIVGIQQLEDSRSRVVSMQNEIKSDNVKFSELKSYISEQLYLINSALNSAIDYKTNISSGSLQLVNESIESYNQNILKGDKQRILVNIFESEGMEYEYNEDGGVSYKYQKTSY